MAQHNKLDEWKGFIKSISDLIVKEQYHLDYLISKNAPKIFIESSKQMLNHYRLRKEQYQKHFEKLKTKKEREFLLKVKKEIEKL